KGFFETIDEIADDLVDEDDDERPPSCEEAYKQIVNGEEYNEEYGYVYGYAYEGLCRALGAETKETWTGIWQSYDWFKDIDKALAKQKIKLKVTDLLYRGALIDIPIPEDFPGLGWWTADEVSKAIAAFNALDGKKSGAKKPKTAKQLTEAIDDIRSW